MTCSSKAKQARCERQRPQKEEVQIKTGTHSAHVGPRQASRARSRRPHCSSLPIAVPSIAGQTRTKAQHRYCMVPTQIRYKPAHGYRVGTIIFWHPGVRAVSAKATAFINNRHIRQQSKKITCAACFPQHTRAPQIAARLNMSSPLHAVTAPHMCMVRVAGAKIMLS